MVDSPGLIENNSLTIPGHQLTVDSQNSNIDPVIDRPTSRDVGQSTITEEIFDLLSKRHVNSTQVQTEPTEIANSEDIKDTPSTSETNNPHNDDNTGGRKNNLRPYSNANYLDVYTKLKTCRICTPL